MRKADAAGHRPIEHCCDHRARLADKRDVSHRCCEVREGGVEPEFRHHDAHTVRSDDAQEMGSRRVEGGPLQRLAPLTEFAETGGDDDGGARASLVQFADQRRNGFGRCDDDREVRSLRQARDIRINGQPIDRPVMRVHQHQLAAKCGTAQVARDHCADRAGPWRGADQRDRARPEQLVEITN